MDTTAADAHFTRWMRGNLDRAARHFDVTVTGAPVLGWRLRSISAPVVGPAGARWLRVVSQEPEWAAGEHWTGGVDAATVTGVHRPRVLDVHEWTDGRRQRAELMTRVPGEPCSPTDALRTVPDLPASWWTDLDGALAALAATPTRRIHVDQDAVTRRIVARFGEVVTTVPRWTTVHGDLHWANLLRTPFGLVDWELWGTAPAGTDEATLFCFSLLVPTVAEQVRHRFAAVLDSPAGQLAQLYVLARLLDRADGGDHPDLVGALRVHAKRLLAP